MYYTKLSSDLVKAFWKHMSNLYGTRITNKSDSNFMKLISQFLDIMKIQDKAMFMNNYATTIGKTIYLPFEIGEVSGKWDLPKQMSICPHEHQHVQQYLRHGFAYNFKYLTNSSDRARYEAEAYSTNIDMHYWYTGKLLNAHDLANKLFNYGCNLADVEMAEKLLKSYSFVTAYGGLTTEASVRAIRWMNDNASPLRFVK